MKSLVIFVMGCQTLKMYCKITSYEAPNIHLSKQNVKYKNTTSGPFCLVCRLNKFFESRCRVLVYGMVPCTTSLPNNVVKWAEVPSLNYDVSHQGSCQGKEDMCIRRPIIVHTASYLIGSQEHRTSVISLPWPCIGSIPVKHAAAK